MYFKINGMANHSTKTNILLYTTSYQIASTSELHPEPYNQMKSRSNFEYAVICHSDMNYSSYIFERLPKICKFFSKNNLLNPRGIFKAKINQEFICNQSVLYLCSKFICKTCNSILVTSNNHFSNGFFLAVGVLG